MEMTHIIETIIDRISHDLVGSEPLCSAIVEYSSKSWGWGIDQYEVISGDFMNSSQTTLSFDVDLEFTCEHGYGAQVIYTSIAGIARLEGQEW